MCVNNIIVRLFCYAHPILLLMFFGRFLPFKAIPPLRILCKRFARVGYLFRRGNLGSKHGLFLAAIFQDFLFSFLFTVLVWGPCVPYYPIPILMINSGK